MLTQIPRHSLKRNASRYLKYGAGPSYVCSSCTRRLHTFAQSTLRQESQALEPLRRRRHTRRLAIPSNASRSLATAADTYTSTDPIPFLSAIDQPSTLRSDGLPFSELRQWSAGNTPLVIHSRLAESPPMIMKRHASHTFGGDFTELLQNLHASLVVGRWDRGANIVRRLATMFQPTAPELLEANKIYLNALVDAVCLQRPEVQVLKVQQWFEVDVRRKGIEPDAQMLASMCRLCFVAMEGPARMRSLRRYLQMAEEADLLHSVMTSGDFLETEWRELVQLRDDLFSLPVQDPVKQEYVDEVVALTREPVELYSIDKLPTVKSQTQKGLGLHTLKRTLAAVEKPDSVPYPSGMDDVTDESIRSTWLRLRQFQLEKDVADASVDRWRAEHQSMLDQGITSSSISKPLNAALYQWYMALQEEIKTEMKACEKVLDAPKLTTAAQKERAEYAPFFLTLKPSTMAALTVSTFINTLVKTATAAEDTSEGSAAQRDLQSTNFVRVSHLTTQIGQQLAAESVVVQKHNLRRNLAISSAVSKYRSEALGGSPSVSTREGQPDTQSAASDPALPTAPIGDPAIMAQFGWPLVAKAQIAAWLISKLIALAKISVSSVYTPVPVDEPAVRYSTYHFRGKSVGVLEIHPKLREIMAKEPPAASLGARLPMLVEPTPWTGFNEGAYLLHPMRAVRMKDSDGVQEMYTRAAAEKGDLDQVFAGLTALGKTGWKINRKVLKVMLDAWNSGEELGAIPPAHVELDLPAPPPESAGLPAKYIWQEQCKARKNEIAGNHAQRCFLNLQLEIAHKFADDVFYLPHNIDFRGRAYPIPPYLNHMGADNSRGLLLFAKGKELGEEGLKWLKVHLANLYGFDKASLKEREDFAMQHLDDITDSVNSPLNGGKWWFKANDPWQCLAACIELKSALESPDPTKYISHLAVHQDGTCNGLQHYAALGGDAFGAAQVNLEPGERPSDVYSGIAELVKAEVKVDAANGEPFALAVDGMITRKVVKQTVMTNVYGVTFVGARDQVLKQLDEIMPEKPGREIDNNILAAYIAKKIFRALGQMFRGAQGIQFWLADCASRISTAVTREQINVFRTQQIDLSGTKGLSHYKPEVISAWLKNHQPNAPKAGEKIKNMFRSPVIWTTPLKLPVVQPYRTSIGQQVETTLQSIKFSKTSTKDPVLKRKQVQGFPPNFIHSLDATHMLLSALKCYEEGLTFAAVHDSFWTHAADIPVMNGILRDAFVRMHSENIIDRLAAEFKARYAGCMYLTSVESSSPLGMKILAMRSTQRTQLKDAKILDKMNTKKFVDFELLTEAQRQDLLNSTVESERRKGESMVTPASMYAQAAPEDLAPDPVAKREALKQKRAASRRRAAYKAAKGLGKAAAEDTEDVTDEALADEGDAEDDTDVTAGELIASYKSNAGVNALEAGNGQPVRPHLSVSGTRVDIWLPLEFPPVPERGDWDVSRLKGSTYFFS